MVDEVTDIKNTTEIIEIVTEGPQGPQGDPGVGGVLPGGLTDQILVKQSDVEGDAAWENQEAQVSAVPVGGLTGQLLTKATNADHDTEWTESAFPEAPLGGAVYGRSGATAAWVLLKSSDVLHETITPGKTAETQIEENRTDVANNTSNISVHRTDIDTNAANIASNDIDIAANLANISTNGNNIASNDVDIAANVANISANTSAITSNDTDIATNAANIAGNVTAIAGKEPAFTKNTGFNKAFGAIVGTVVQGNDARLTDSRVPTAHTHLEVDVTNLDKYTKAEVDAALALKEGVINPKLSAFNKAYGNTAGTTTEGNDPRLSDKRDPNTHLHTESDISNLDKYTQAEVDASLALKEDAFTKNTGFNKPFGSSIGTVVQGNDSRLSDTRDPNAHSHTESDISDLDKYTKAEADSLLANKSDTGHIHTALSTTYDNTVSGLSAIEVKGALDELAVITTPDKWEAEATHVGSNGIASDFNAMDWTGHAHASGTSLVVVLQDEIYCSNQTGITYIWIGPTNVTLGLGGDYISLDSDYVVLGISDHKSLVGRELADQHSIAAITGLQTELDGKEPVIVSKLTGFNKNFGDTANDVCVGDDPRLSDSRTSLAHTHLEADISDLNKYTQIEVDNLVNLKEDIISPKNTAFNLSFGTTAGTVAAGDDSRFTDARTPTAHTHTEAEITDLDKYTKAEVDARALNDLVDVSLVSPNTGDKLIFDGATQTWIATEDKTSVGAVIYNYEMILPPSSTPSAGRLSRDTTDLSLVTELYVNEVDSLGDLNDTYWGEIKRLDWLRYSSSNADGYEYYIATGPATEALGIWTIPVVYDANGGTPLVTTEKTTLAWRSVNIEVINNLASTLTDAALSANQGRVLNELKTEWKNVWLQQSYKKGDIVRDGAWTMVANTTTVERPAPQAIGSKTFFVTDPLIAGSTTAKSVLFGMRLTMPVAGYLDAYRIDTRVGNQYNVYSVRDPLGAKIITQLGSFTGAVDGWQEFSLQVELLFKDTVIDLVIEALEPSPTPTEFLGNWDYNTPQNSSNPVSGQIVHANTSTDILRVHITDNASVDRYTELAALVVGDVIHSQGNDWVIQVIDNQTTYFNFSISPAVQSAPDGVVEFRFETVTATPISYGKIIDWWAGATLGRGLFVADGDYGNIIPDDNAYGVDIRLQEASFSADWDLLANSEGGSSGTAGAGGIANDIDTSVTNFNNNLSSADTTVQKALDTIDNLSVLLAGDVDAFEVTFDDTAVPGNTIGSNLQSSTDALKTVMLNAAQHAAIEASNSPGSTNAVATMQDITDNPTELVLDPSPQLGGNLDCNSKFLVGSSYKSPTAGSPLTGTTHTFDFQNGDMQRVTSPAGGTLAIAFSGFVTGQVCSYIIEARNWGNSTIVWPVGMEFDSGVFPTFTVSGKDKLLVIKDRNDNYSVALMTLDNKAAT